MYSYYENNENITFMFKNGFHIHFIHAFLYLWLQDVFLSTIIAIKLYSINYFFWFGTEYNFFPNTSRLNWVKQFIRFTDTGHLASFLVLFCPHLIPVAHNIHFTIMIGYWGGRFAFGVKDADHIEHVDLIPWHTDMLTGIHHIVPYCLIGWKIYSATECYDFNWVSTYQSVAWLCTWFFGVYLPWRFITGDTVYSILDATTRPETQFIFMGLIIWLVVLGNYVGSLLCK